MYVYYVVGCDCAHTFGKVRPLCKPCVYCHFVFVRATLGIQSAEAFFSGGGGGSDPFGPFAQVAT